MPSRTLCYLVERLGPYHIARLNTAASIRPDIAAIELCPTAATYPWTTTVANPAFQVIQLPQLDRPSLHGILSSVEAAVVFLNGWSDRGALWALEWCVRHRVPSVIMSDSQEHDEPRK